MTRMPLVYPAHPLFQITRPLRLSSMAAEAHTNSSQLQPENAPKTLADYPVPLSPPPPLLSKNVELNRALTASSKSVIFTLSRNDVLFEDEWLIAVNKPQGIYCESILSSVRSLLNPNQGKLQEFHLSNRLDRDTSGVTVVTKSHKVAAKLVKAFTDHMVKKTYLALCVGSVPKWDKIVVKSGHGRSKHGAWRIYAVSDVGRTLPGGSCIRDMETLVEVLSVDGKGCSQESLGSGKHEENTIVVKEKSEITSCTEKSEVLVRAYPRSGRTHQIRLHCQYLGIPIRGDVKYEGVYEWKDRIYEGHELHAESLSFEHPVTGHSVLIRAPLPLWASKALSKVYS
ncbi:RNA pseudouridine synthase 1 isoform X2 [Salvia hispanica]|uniref:RNA pseudouridine synthase 1 isoform X2 n=1 Tax=Salvia hispanica TaxID=49212 RepID=UPI002008FD71|nr:RNA pseudouridine synthase 1 isoform X2 [Salvia hispanica]